ncbi:CAP domain-containing protein [Bacillus sp. Marseille-Q3570]|uniref:CAP domain-containing protein n=1 Tax=Bacillus sp. Marseille-Q3570 TaxID=2963522 RepID=UPI0021B7ED89|nr:CAP domain-containing protein [Bacillus sp. Marseille-Q3570]
MKKRIVTLGLTALLSAGMLAGCNIDDTGQNNEEGMQYNTVRYDRTNDRTRINQNNRFTPIWGNGGSFQNRYNAHNAQGPYGQQYGGGFQNTQPNMQQPGDTAQQPDDTTQQPGGGAAMSEMEKQVVELTNQERMKNGLSALKADAELAQVAQKKADDLAQNNYFSHNSPTYGSPFQMMQQNGVDYTSAAENIAAGQQSAEQVVQQWMNSPSHRENIMNGQLTHIGVGLSKGGQQGNCWSQMFIQK